MKEKIIQKCGELFINLGFKSVTMDDIANEMGISKKTIYSHFKNKAELVKETTFSIVEKINYGINCICELDKDPIEELYEIKKYVMIHLKQEKASPQFQLQKYYPEIHESFKHKQFKRMQECTISNLQRGIKKGSYRKNIDVNLISRLYFTGVNSIKDKGIFPPQKFPKPKLMDDYLEYHLRGIVTEKGLIKLNQIIKKNNQNE